MKQKRWASALIFFASPSEGDFQSQLQLFEDLSNKKLQRYRLRTIILSEPWSCLSPAHGKKGIYLVNLDEKKSTWII